MTLSIEIVVLAMVAAFLGLRLYSVLGKRTGHEQEPPMPRVEEREREAAPRPQPPKLKPVPDLVPARVTRPEMVYEDAAEPGMRAILAADRDFDVARFVEGAKAAYGMILEAFWSGDRATLRDLCDDDVYDSFDAAITERETQGEQLDNRLVRIEKARIIAADYRRPMASITVQFDADIAAVVRDKDGALIAGSLTDAVETHDIWTFSRDVTSGGPDWRLDETDAA